MENGPVIDRSGSGMDYRRILQSLAHRFWKVYHERINNPSHNHKQFINESYKF